MQAYQNYSQPMMNNPYQNGCNPMLSPQQRLMQMEQQYQLMQQGQPQFIVGKVVNDFSEITAMDVPQSGQAAFFPKSDGSEIQVRSRADDGLIRKALYRPFFEQNQENGTNVPQMDFNALNEDVRALREDIKNVRDMIEKSMNVPTQKQTPPRAKKGADEE